MREDILSLPRPVSQKHARMSMSDRAAQFAPFAALTGFDALVEERARLTQARRELDEGEKAALDERLRAIGARLPAEAEITYFVPDRRKAGGAYVTARGRVRRLDPVARMVYMDDGTAIPVEDICAVTADWLERCFAGL